MKNDMVAHLWANRSQESASNPQKNFFFIGDTIYSYRTPIAQHITHKGQSAVLLTNWTHSKTTKGHKRLVETACSHLPVFHTYEFTCNHSQQLAVYRAEYATLVGKCVKARGSRRLEALHRLVEEANQYAAFFGLETRLSVPDDLLAEHKAIEKRQRNRTRRKAQRERAVATRYLDRWVAGIECWALRPSLVSMLPVRLRVKGNEVQTSLGAVIPLDHAVKAYRVLRRLKGKAYQGNTIHLGPFVLDAIDTEGNVTAGCHTIAWSEIERIATLAGIE